ncbi:hypothetical protein B0H17DRAFT_44213, partial [Mycena rosella]
DITACITPCITTTCTTTTRRSHPIRCIVNVYLYYYHQLVHHHRDVYPPPFRRHSLLILISVASCLPLGLVPSPAPQPRPVSLALYPRCKPALAFPSLCSCFDCCPPAISSSFVLLSMLLGAPLALLSVSDTFFRSAFASRFCPFKLYRPVVKLFGHPLATHQTQAPQSCTPNPQTCLAPQPLLNMMYPATATRIPAMPDIAPASASSTSTRRM